MTLEAAKEAAAFLSQVTPVLACGSFILFPPEIKVQTFTSYN